MTAQGHPRAIIRRAIERGNVVVAEATAREFALSLEVRYWPFTAWFGNASTVGRGHLALS